MLGWLYRILIGNFHIHHCQHRWETMHNTKVYDYSFGETDLPDHTLVHLRCTKCGDWMTKKLKPPKAPWWKYEGM